MSPAAAVASLHTVMVGAGGFRDGDPAVFNGYDIGAVAAFDGKRVILQQVYGLDEFAVRPDFRPLGFFARLEKKNTCPHAQQKHNGKQYNPVFALQIGTSFQM